MNNPLTKKEINDDARSVSSQSSKLSKMSKYSKTSNTSSSIRFDRINKYSVTVKSLRNQLKHAEGLDELTTIASKIVDLENQILIERSAGYKQLEEEKKLIERKVKRLSREISRANQDLERIGNSLEFRLNGYKKTLQGKIEELNTEYSTMLEYLASIKK